MKISIKLNKKEIYTLALIIFIALLSCFPLFLNINKESSNVDWQLSNLLHGSFRKAVLEKGQFPLRNPYINGGFPILGHPHDSSLTPFIIIDLIFGEVIGLKIAVLITYIIGAVGMFYLTRKVLKFPLLPSFFSTCLLLLSPWFFSRVAGGNPSELKLFYFPLIFALFLKLEKKKAIFFIAFIWALFLNDSKWILMDVVLIMGCTALLKDLELYLKKRCSPKHIISLFAIIVLIFFFGMAKFLPMIELLSIDPRAMTDYSVASQSSYGWNLPLLLISPIKGATPIIPDVYLGLIPIILALLAAFVFFRQIKEYILILVISIALSMGRNFPIDFFYLLWKLPLYHSMHSPIKHFNFFIVFSLSILAGKGLSYIYQKKFHFKQAIILFLIIISIAPLFLNNIIITKDIFDLERQKFSSTENEYYQIVYEDDILEMQETPYNRYWNLQQNIGTVNWEKDTIQIPSRGIMPKYFVSKEGKRLNEEYKGEAFFNDDLNKAEVLYLSPNKIIVSVDVKTPSDLIINQNYERYWKAKEGILFKYPIIANNKLFPRHHPFKNSGLIGVKLKNTGKYTVELNYHPLLFYLGLIISLISICLSVAYLKFYEK